MMIKSAYGYEPAQIEAGSVELIIASALLRLRKPFHFSTKGGAPVRR
jgi:hypothetical protein